MVGPVADENKAHSGTRRARTLKTRHDQNNQPKTSAPGRADEPIKFPATARGDERTNHRTRPARLRSVVRLVTANGTTPGADTLTERCWRPLRAAGRAAFTNRLTPGQRRVRRVWRRSLLRGSHARLSRRWGEHPGLNGWQAWQNIPENGTGDGDGRARQRPVVPVPLPCLFVTTVNEGATSALWP